MVARPLSDLSEWQVEVGTARGAVLDEVARMAETVGFGRAERLFVSMAKAGDLDQTMQDLVRIANARRGKGARTISKARLWAWRKLAAGAATPVERIVRLAPKTRGKKWTLTEDVAAALAAYRQPNKPSLSGCVKSVAAQLNIPFDALYSRCRRELKKLPRQIFYVGRNSGAALKALQPFRRREFHSLLPNDIWVGDGHSMKLRIAHPETGSPFVPEVTVIMDVQSRYVVGWSVSLSENCLAVSDAMRHGIAQHGVPLIYYSDNGAGQTAKMLDAPLTGLLPAMGIRHETGRAGNPQGRGVIERFWSTVTIPLAKRFATYQGNGADRETLRAVSAEIGKQLRAAQRSEVAVLPAKLPSFAQFIDALDAEIEAYNTRHCHRSLPKLDGVNHATPAEYRAARIAGVDIHIPDAMELAALFMPSTIRQATRGEVRLWNGIYFSRDLMLVDGERVRVHYDIHDASKVWVKKMSGELIACAELNGNRSGYMPKPVIEQLREERASRRMRLLQDKMDGVRAELQGSTFTRPAPQAARMTPEQAEMHERIVAELDGAGSSPAPAASRSSVLEMHDGRGRWDFARIIAQRLAAGLPAEERDVQWAARYRDSDECHAMERMFAEHYEPGQFLREIGFQM